MLAPVQATWLSHGVDADVHAAVSVAIMERKLENWIEED